MNKLAIIALSVATGLAGAAPVYAAPFSTTTPSGVVVDQSNVIKVDDDWRRHHDHGWNGDHHHHHGNAGAIIGGLAAGAIIGGALAQPRDDGYQRDRYYYRERPVYHRYDYDDEGY